ncbi:MAG: hypothetical protein AAF682_06275 [Planctomycetota bacterium]
MIPTSYEQWRECIEVHCKIALTSPYISDRLTELENGEHPKTKSFESLYGADHLQRTIAWFRRAASEATVGQ